MQVDVKAQKNIHTSGCRPSSELKHRVLYTKHRVLSCGFALNRVQRLSVQGFKTRLNRSRGSRVWRDSLSVLSGMHYSLRFSWKTVWKQFLPLVFIPKSKLVGGVVPIGHPSPPFNFLLNLNLKTQEREFLPAINNGVSFANFL